MHEYYIDENECQASPDMKDAFVLCRVTRRDDWALENDNGVGNRNPHPQQPNDATSVVIAEKEDAAVSGICAEEPNHVATPASAEQSNGFATKESIAHSPNSDSVEAFLKDIILPNHPMDTGSSELSQIEQDDVSSNFHEPCSLNDDSEMKAIFEALLADLSPNPAMDNGYSELSQIEQDVVSSNLQIPCSMVPKIESGHCSPIQNGIDDTHHLMFEDLCDIFPSIDGFSDAFGANQMDNMMGMDHVITPNNFQGTNGEPQLYQEYNANVPNENADNGITVRRRNSTASSSPPSTQRIRLQVGVNRMVTSNSETINQTIKFAGNSGRMRSFRQSDATKSNENYCNQGSSKGIKNAFRSSAGFNVLFACICMIGVIAAVLHGYYRPGISFNS